MNIDPKQIETLLAEKKYDEVRKIITDAVKEDIPGEEKGAILVGFASAYMTISNAINEQYRDALKEAIAGMEMINKAESETIDQIKLDEVKNNLGI